MSLRRKPKGKRHIQLGCSNELLVAIDLFNKGFDVFRALASAAPFDLIAYKECKTLKIEVKQTYPRLNGNVNIPPHTHQEHDIMALVYEGHIIYRPDLPL